MSRTLILVVIPFFILACGGEESTVTPSNAVDIPLDGTGEALVSFSEEEGRESASPVGAKNAEVEKASTPAGGAAVESGQAMPAGASKLAPSTALTGLDAWHRQLLAQRTSAAADDSFLGSSLSGFAGIFSGNAEAYRNSLRNDSPATFGSDFQRYASAWASGGPSGLQKALASGPVGTAKLVWTDALVNLSLAADDYQTAGTALATVLNDMLGAGYTRERILELSDRIHLVGRNAAKFLPFTDYVVAGGDSYWKICRKFREQGVIAPQGWIAEFNHKRNYRLNASETLKIPTSTLEVKAWRNARLLVLYADRVPIRLYPVSMGLMAKPTPLGAFTLSTELLEDPVYYPAGGTPVPFGNPDNPLGERWMGFQEDRQYGIHGTNSEDTIGSFESGGCIRMHNADAKELFELVAAGVKVTIYA